MILHFPPSSPRRAGSTLVLSAWLLLGAWQAGAQQSWSAGPHGLRHGVSLTVLGSVMPDSGFLPESRVPSGRAVANLQIGRTFGLHFGALRLAPTNVGLWSGVAGIDVTLLRGRFRVALFGEGGGGMFDAAVDSGGASFANPDGSAYDRPYLRPIDGVAFGGGGGISADVVLFSGVSLNLTGGYWHFVAPAGDGFTIGGPYLGVGLRIRRANDPWYWRTSGRDTIGGHVSVLASRHDGGGHRIGYGDLRVVAHDISDVAAVRIAGRDVALRPAPAAGWSAPGVGRLAVVPRSDLALAPGENQVAVEVEDGAGNIARHVLTLIGPPQDEAAPRVVITTPAPDALLTSDHVEVRGFVVDASPIDSVHVNGAIGRIEPAPVAVLRAAGLEPETHESGWSFSATAPVIAGRSPIDAVAVDTAGNGGTASRMVSRPDDSPPRFALVEPRSGSQVNARHAQVTGVVADDGMVSSIAINGVPARIERLTDRSMRGIQAVERDPVDASGLRYHFDATVTLEPGVNTLLLEATDASGNRAEGAHELFLTRTTVATVAGPEIRVEEPSEWGGAATRGIEATARTSIRVTGTVHDPMGAGIREVKIDGQRAAMQAMPGSAAVRFIGFVPVDADRDDVEIAVWTNDGRSTARLYDIEPTAPTTDDWRSAARFSGRRFAVVIGISDYRDERMRDLRYADDDAQAFYDFLTSPAAGGGGVPQENITLLLNEQATYREMRSALYTFLERATEDDIVYIYIAAHGAPNPRRRDDLFILPYDTELNDLAGTAMPMDHVNEAVRKLLARHTVLITDACHSGAMGMGGLGSTRAGLDDATMNAINQEFLMGLQATHGGLAIFTASEAGQPSLEGEEYGGGHGIFTYHLLEGLRGAADEDANRIVSWGEVVEYTRRMVIRQTHSAQSPSIGSQTHDRHMPIAIVLEEAP